MPFDTQMTAGVRLTIFDEQTLVRDCIARLLESAGFAVAAQAGEPHGFLTGLTQLRPDVALISIGNPEVLTTVEEAHQMQPEVRLLVLAPGLEPELMDRCFRAGAAGFLDKGVARLEALVDAIHAVARGNNVFPAHAVESLLRSAGRRDSGTELLRGLSERERQVLAFLSVGADNLQIASMLKISERTVKAHVSNLYRKLGQDNRTQLALIARQWGIRPPAGWQTRAEVPREP